MRKSIKLINPKDTPVLEDVKIFPKMLPEYVIAAEDMEEGETAFISFNFGDSAGYLHKSNKAGKA